MFNNLLKSNYKSRLEIVFYTQNQSNILLTIKLKLISEQVRNFWLLYKISTNPTPTLQIDLDQFNHVISYGNGRLYPLTHKFIKKPSAKEKKIIKTHYLNAWLDINIVKTWYKKMGIFTLFLSDEESKTVQERESLAILPLSSESSPVLQPPFL